MISHPLETKSDLKKYSVGYVVNQHSNENITDERTKHVGSTSPAISNILNKNTNDNSGGILHQGSTPKVNEAPKIFSSRGLLLPSASEINTKPPTTILGNPSNERSYILSNHGGASKQQVGSNSSVAAAQTGDGLSTPTETLATERADSLAQDAPSEKLPVVAETDTAKLRADKMNQYTFTQSTTPVTSTNKLKPLEVPPPSGVSGQGPLGPESRNSSTVPSVPYVEGDYRVIYGARTPSGISNYGRANSAFSGGAHRAEDMHYLTVANAQYSQPLQPQHADSRSSYYSRVSNASVPDGSLYNTGRTARYNSVDSHVTDLDMSNRLPHFDRVHPLVDPRQQYYNAHYRIDEGTTHSAFPPVFAGGKYGRQNSTSAIPGTGTGMYHPRHGSMVGVVPTVYQEQEHADGSLIGSAYEKYHNRVLSADHGSQGANLYSNGVYSYNPSVQGPPQMLQFQQQQPGQYGYPLVLNQQGAPHYGKMLNHMHKKKINQCNICGKILTRPSSLHSHMFVHTGDRPYVCKWPNCGKTFNVKSNMNRHYKLHLKRQVIDEKLGLKTIESKGVESGDAT